MVKKFALDVLKKKYPHLSGVQMVHFMNFRELPEKQEITPGNFLLGGTELSDRGLVEPTMDWIKSNQEKFLLVIDGADQYKDKPKKLGKKSPVKRYKGQEHSTDILNSLLGGQLFPNIRILYSSREHAIRFFEDEVRPHRVIALKGFQKNEVERLVRGFGGENGDAIWNHLTNKSAALLSICSIPMFLVFTVSVLKRHLKNPPETLTGVLMYVLSDLVTSEHIRNRVQIYDVLHVLKTVSFKSTKDMRVTFTLSDLPPDTKTHEIQDLVITLLGSDARNRRLLEGHWKYIFCHQSLQEALAALYIAEMATSDFEEIIEKEIHKPHWSVVRRLLCGIVVDRSIDSIVRGNVDSVSLSRAREIDSKRECLVENLRRRVDELQKSIEGLETNDAPAIITLQNDFLEILHVIHECSDGADEILSSLQRIDIDCLFALTASDDHVVVDAVRRCPNLDYVRIFPGSQQLWENLALALAQHRTKIGTLKILNRSGIFPIVTEALDENMINDLLPHVKHELELHALKFRQYDIQAIQNKLDSLPPTDLVVKLKYLGSVRHTLKQRSRRCMAD